VSAFRDALAQTLEFWGGDEMVPNYDDADAILAMPEMQWVKQFLVDTLNTDFLGNYQCEIVGPVPPVLLSWAGVDDDWAGGPS